LCDINPTPALSLGTEVITHNTVRDSNSISYSTRTVRWEYSLYYNQLAISLKYRDFAEPRMGPTTSSGSFPRTA